MERQLDAQTPSLVDLEAQRAIEAGSIKPPALDLSGSFLPGTTATGRGAEVIQETTRVPSEITEETLEAIKASLEQLRR